MKLNYAWWSCHVATMSHDFNETCNGIGWRKKTSHTENEHLFFDGKQNQFRFLLLHLHEVTTGNFIYRSVKEKSRVWHTRVRCFFSLKYLDCFVYKTAIFALQMVIIRFSLVSHKKISTPQTDHDALNVNSSTSMWGEYIQR